MKKEHQIIIELISNYLRAHPDQRFGQVLFNLGVNYFGKTTDPRNPNRIIQDIHGDSDESIINRIQGQLDWFDLQTRVSKGLERVDDLDEMTVDEKLDASGLREIFEKKMKTEKRYAKYILKSLKVDKKLIAQILELD